MNCESARDKLLEADRGVLEGLGEDPLAQHLRSCPRCGAVGRALLMGEAELEASLSIEAPPLDLEAVLVRAAARGPKGSKPAAAGPTPIRWYLRPWSLVPLAAAAGAIVLALGRAPSLPGPPYFPPAPPPGIDVQTPPERDVAVLETRNPDIVVVWLF